MNENKVFYLHIPKTAGSFFNKFLSSQYKSYIDHVESKIDFSKEEDLQKLQNYQAFSGHIPFPIVKQKIGLKNLKTITILRNPMEQVISHITYVRELGEESEKHRFAMHNDIIKNIVKRLKKTDLSNDKELLVFIKWLEKNKIGLFHDCQTRYLGGGAEHIKPQNLNVALNSLEKIDYVGITERLKEFMILLSLKESFKLVKYTKENITKNRYGLDINNIEIRKILQPLIQNDVIVYKFARKKFIKGLYEALYKFELKKGPRYSPVRVDMLFNELKGGADV